jgi:hypothetical protein
MNPEELIQSLLTVPKFEPRAVRLLREQRDRTGELWPKIDNINERQHLWREMESMREAASEMLEKVSKLRPVPIQGSVEIQRIFL